MLLTFTPDGAESATRLRAKAGADDWQDLFGHVLNVYEQLIELDEEGFRLYAASRDLDVTISIRGLRLKNSADVAHLQEVTPEEDTWN